MAVASAGPYASLHLLQTDDHASIPPLSFLQAGCPSCRPTNSVKALKAQSVDNNNKVIKINFINNVQLRTNVKINQTINALTIIKPSSLQPKLAYCTQGRLAEVSLAVATGLHDTAQLSVQ